MRSFLEDPFRKRFRIQRYLFRQWIHVCVSSRGAWFDGAVNCGFSAVAVHRRSSISLSWCRGRFHDLACSEDQRDSAVAVSFLVVEALLCRSCLLCPLLLRQARMVETLQKFVLVPQSQFLRLWTSLYYAATSCLATAKVPQIQFIAGVSGHFSRHRYRYAQLQLHGRHGGGDEG